MIRLHLIAFLCGSLLDLLIGDPHSIPHPVQLIGKLISVLDSYFQGRAETRARVEGQASSRPAVKKGMSRQSRYIILRGRSSEALENEIIDNDKERVSVLKRRYGRIMAIIVVAVAAGVTALILWAGYQIHPVLGFIIESIMTCQILAGRSLQKESMRVYDRLKNGTLEEARKAVSMIVGRDTERLSEEGVTKAAVETVAENASDGVIAPMLYTALGGPVLGWAYKAVNTMDSMVGYKNEKYNDFGRGAAHLDDVVNYLPSRISAVLMIAAAWILQEITKRHSKARGIVNFYNSKNAARIWKRDRRKHASPNSAQTESVMAGALQVQLAGDAYYFGKLVKKPLIGDPIRPIEAEDIRRANHLMLATAAVCEVICITAMAAAILL